MLEKAIFIVGSGRCGTSWIQDWLLQHPQICGEFNESKLFDVLSGIFKHPQKMHFNKQDFKTNGIYEWIEPEEFADAVSNFVFEIFDKYCHKQGRPYVVEKTPRHFWSSESINRTLAHRCEVYFIHLYRDGRNVLESFLRQVWSPEPYVATPHWIKEMEYMLAGECPENMLHLKYEDLIHDPKIGEQTILSFCGLKYHKSIELFQKGFSGHTILEYDPNRWKRIIGYGFLRKCCTEMIPTLRKLGYPVGGDQLPKG